MKNNNTKPSNVQTDNVNDDRMKSLDAASRFLDRFGVVKLLGVTETQIQVVVDYVVSALPGYLQRTLSAANNLAQVA